MACPAEDLGIELPEGGVNAISAQDLQRDIYGLSQPDAEHFWETRMTQMNVTSQNAGEGWHCANIGVDSTLTLSAPWPSDPSSMAQAAALISLAKGWDGEAPRAGIRLCMGTIEGELPLSKLPTLAGRPLEHIEDFDYLAMQNELRARFKGLD